MKRFTILLLSLMTLGMYAQDPNPISISTDFTVGYGTGYPKGEQVLFEPDNYNTDVTEIAGVWTAGTTENKATYKVIANPAQGGINTSAKCLEVTCRNYDGSIGIDFQKLLTYKPNLNGRRRISMLFKAGKNGETPLGNDYYTQLQLETNYGTEGNQVYCLGAYYDAIDNDEAGHDGWKRLYFDFTPYNIKDNNSTTGYHPYVIGDFPYQLVFKPKICKVTIASDNRTIESHESHTCSDGDVYYIDEIKVEDVPYAEGYWIHDWKKGTFDADATPKWNTDACELPISGSKGVLHLSGTWLKGQNIVNPEIWEKGVAGNPWVYEFNEYRDLSWHVKPDEVKLMVFKNDSKLRWPDRGGLLGTNTGTPEAAVERFIDNLNVLIFAEKSCILPDEVDNLAANWHDTNAVIHYSNDDSWKAWELEMTDAYPFLNPQEFTVENKIKCHRRMENGFNTLIYPFYLTPEELCSSRVGTIYHHKDSEKLYFVPRDQTEPNVPYLTENFTSTFVEDVKNVTNNYQEFPVQRTVSVVDSERTYSNTEETGALLHGTYKTISGTNLWGIATQKDSSDKITWQGFMKGGDNAKFKPFRAYLDFPADAAPSRLSIFYDETLGISPECASFEPEAIESIYDLQGRAVKGQSIATLQKGIYIINGKKTFIK